MRSMAGSWNHIVTDDGKFRNVELIDNLGDAWEALEQCYGMVWWLAERAATPPPVRRGDAAVLIEEARQHYEEGIALSPGLKQPSGTAPADRPPWTPMRG